MKLKKNKILKFLVSVIISFIVCCTMLVTNRNISSVFFLESLIMFTFFINIVINAEDRFFPISFLLISVFLGFLDLIFVVCDLRIVSNKYSMEIYEKSLLLFIIWIFSFVIAYMYKKNVKERFVFRGTKIVNNVINSINIDYVIVISILIQAFIAFKILNTVRAVGGISIAMNNFAVFKYNNQGYLTTLFPLLSLVSISLYEKNFKKISFLSMIINFFLISITGRRGLAINTIIVPFLVFYNYKIKKVENKTILLILIPIIIFVMFVGSVRNQQINYGSNNILTKSLTYLTNTIQYGQNVPDMVYSMDNGIVEFQHGKYLFNGILGMIPRAVWSNKPESDNSHITSMAIYGADITYGKPVAFGFAYFCYRYLGVIVSGLICGYFSCLIYKWMLKNKTIFPVLIYSILIQSFIYLTNPDSQVKIITLFLLFIVISFITSIKNGKIVLVRGE